MENKDLDQLIVSDKGRLELSLRQGKSMVFRGRYAPRDGSRELKIQFTYNKTFRFVDNIERQGSWTVDMRPDYTLSIWPWPYARIEDAEKIDAVVHIHFDAKYKIDKFLEIFGDMPSGAQASEVADAALNKIMDEEARGEYKRGDLLKMHSGSTITNLLFRIDKGKPPKLMSKSDLLRLGYPSTPSGDAYLLFKLFEIKDGEPLYGMKCDISKLSQYAGGRASSRPMTVTFHDLMLHAIVSA